MARRVHTASRSNCSPLEVLTQRLARNMSYHGRQREPFYTLAYGRRCAGVSQLLSLPAVSHGIETRTASKAMYGHSSPVYYYDKIRTLFSEHGETLFLVCILPCPCLEKRLSVGRTVLTYTKLVLLPSLSKFAGRIDTRVLKEVERIALTI